ncbi:MAG: alpha/beta hydrolase [Burkholderiales bacterium]
MRRVGRLNIFDNGPCAMQPVFRDYDQKALDDAYDQAVYAPNRDQLLERRNLASEAARTRLGEPQRFAYGAGPNEQLDVYASRTGTHIQVFVHGGAWRAGRAREYAAPAEMFIGAGAHYVVLDFDNAPDCGGDLFVMADQVRRAIAWVYRNAALFGGDAEHIYVSGTSSGAHLAGVAAATDWQRFGMPGSLVKGYTLCSGMYDLRGPRLSKRSAYIRFSDAMETELSPQRHVERICAPMVLLYGSLETPEFQRQAREFAVALEGAGKAVELIRAAGYNHFEVAETLGNPYGPMGRAVLEQMGLLVHPESTRPELIRPGARGAPGAPSPT